jgi:hypothetical protein
MNPKSDKEMKRFIGGGATLLEMIMKGKDEKSCWDQLMKDGFNPEECVEIAKTVQSFMKHKNGNHESCPNNCGMTEQLSKDVKKLGREPSYDETIDMIRAKETQQNNMTFSDDVLEEFK